MKKGLRWIAWGTALLMMSAPWAWGQGAQNAPGAPKKEMVAVMDFQVMGATPSQAAGLSNQFRAEVLKSGLFTLVDRNQLDAILKEQALQSAGCTTQECAVKLGQIMGVKKIITGTVNAMGDDLWQVNAQMTDVETAATLKVENLNHKGKFETLLFEGMAKLAAKMLVPEAPAKQAGKAKEVPPPVVPSGPAEPDQPQTLSGWRWKWGTSLAAGALTGLMALNSQDAVHQYNTSSAKNMQQAQQATNATDYQAYQAKAQADYQKAKAAAADASTFQLVSLVGLGLAGWFYWDAPEGMAQAWVEPAPEANGWRITYQRRW